VETGIGSGRLGAWRGSVFALLLAIAPSSQAGDVVLEIDPASILAPPPDAVAPVVEVSDIRETTALERTTVGQVSLGQIDVVPPLPELIGAVVSAKASGIPVEPAGEEAGVAEPPVIYCGLRRFSIETPATLLYWDIESRIEIVLRVGEQEREVAASAKARTWVYPSKTLLEKVTREALVDLAARLDEPLAELLAVAAPEEPEAAETPEEEPPAEP
jgi:hypothetical protein